MNTVFPQSLRVGAQNNVHNRDFSENPRWGPYKIREKNITNQHEVLYQTRGYFPTLDLFGR